MKIYLAARYSRRDEMREYLAELTRIGYDVCSRWLTTNHDIEDGDLSDARTNQRVQELASRYASDDLQDVGECDILVLFTEEPRAKPSRGGRMVEFGYAIAAGKTVCIVGPDENVFSTLPRVLRFEAWGELLDELHMTVKL